MTPSHDVKEQNISEKTPKSTLCCIRRSVSYIIFYKSFNKVKFV